MVASPHSFFEGFKTDKLMIRQHDKYYKTTYGRKYTLEDVRPKARLLSYHKSLVFCLLSFSLLMVRGSELLYSQTDNVKTNLKINRLADAIFKAEGGLHTRHPYGILKKFKSTTPRQACLNTIKSRYKSWLKAGQPKPFISYLASSYAPLGAKNDPLNLNSNWIKNVEAFYGT